MNEKDNAEYRRRAEELVAQMTVDEAASQLRYDALAIPRLGIPAYNWWNEALHGVARAGTATVFPQAIGLAAMFDPDFQRQIGDVVATEARARYNMQSTQGDRDIYKGLTVWSPNINIFRDPRWGRGQETYGEDPFLTRTLGVAYIKGLQGEGRHLKTAACAKHFAVHSGPEAVRHSFDAHTNAKDMEETYLPAFEGAVKEGQVESVMGAYNRTNGEPCCGSKTLLQDILRNKWGFDGHVVSDCWAIADFHMYHHITDTPAESAALALTNGCDLNCGNTYLQMLVALEEGLVTEEQIRQAAIRVMTTRMRLGILGESSEYDSIPFEENDSPVHRELAREAARRSAVLLKNDGILPLDSSKLRSIAVIGPNADSRSVLEGNYCGTASEYVTNLEGIRAAVGADVRVFYSIGSQIFKDRIEGLAQPGDRLSEAKACAARADVVVLCLGLDGSLEGEQGDAGNSYASGDKPDLLLPEIQRRLLDEVLSAGKPVILVLNNGSALDVGQAADRCAAVLECWYSGAQGGNALADLLFGKADPSGRLPITFYHDGELPDFEDYSMHGRTYRYLQGEALYPFGYGLSYTTFRYENLRLEPLSAENTLTGEVTVANTGSRKGAEVVELYLNCHAAENANDSRNTALGGKIGEQPHWSLCGVQRVELDVGESRNIRFKIPAFCLESVLEDGARAILAGRYTLYAGGSQPDARSISLTGQRPVNKEFTIE